MSHKFFKFLTYIAICTMLLTMVLGTTAAQAQTVAPTLTAISVFGGIGVQYSYGDRFWGNCTSSDAGVLAVGDCSSLDGDLAGIRKGNPPPQDYTDALIVKFSADSSVAWKQCFGGNGSDIAQDAVQTSDSGYVVVGASNSLDVDLTGIRRDTSVSYSDGFIVKYDISGNVVWKSCFGSSSSSDRYMGVTQTSDNGIVAVGFASYFGNGDWAGSGVTGKGGQDCIVVKYDNNGSILWKKTVGGSQNEWFYDAAPDNDGGVAVVGWTSSNDNDFAGMNHGSYSQDMVIAHFDSAGNRSWVKTFGGSNSESSNFVCATTDGGFICTGGGSSTDGDLASLSPRGNNDGIVVKYDFAGNLEWKQIFGGSEHDGVNGVVQTPDGGFIVSGYTASGDFDFAGIRRHTNGTTNYDAFITGLNADGSKSWIKMYGGIATGNDRIGDVVALPNGQVAVSGTTTASDGDFTGLYKGTTHENAVVVRFALDTQPPTIATTSVTVGLLFSDTITGVATQEYAWSLSEAEVPTEWTAYTEPITQSAGGTWYLWVKAADNSGNTITRCIGTYQVEAITQ